MNKKICYLVEDGRLSGPIVQIINIYSELKENFDQTILFSKFRSEKTIEILKKKNLKYITLDTNVLSSNPLTLINYIIDFIFSFRKIFSVIKNEKFELAFVNGSSQFKFLIICWLLKIKIIWCINDAYSNKLLKFIISIFSIIPNHIVFVSKNSKNFYFNNFFFKKKKFDIIQSSHNFNNSINESLKNMTLKKNNENFIVGSLGNISPIKNFNFMIEIACLAKRDKQNITFLNAGAILSSQKRYFEKLKKRIHENDLNNVIFKDFVEDTKSFYQMIDIYACYSKSEASPTSIWEAMSFGKPIISTNVGDLKELNIENSFGYTIDNFDKSLFYKNIIKMKNNNSLFKSFSNSSYSHSLNFSADKVSLEYLRIFNFFLE